jgi:hypothetical protein
MSKTFEEIGLIVGGVALAVLAGPAGVIVLSGAMASYQSALVGIGITSALSGVGLALRQTPKTVGTANSIAFQNGPAPRRCIYGQFQTAGVLTYASFPASQNLATTSEFLHLVYTLTSHEITSFDAVIVNGFVYNFGTDIFENSSLPGTPWQINVDNVSGSDFFGEHMMFEFDAGKPGNTAQPFPNLANADVAWTSAFLQRGCAKVHVILRYDSGWTALYPSGQLPNIQFLVTGKKVVDPRVVTAWQASTNYAQYQYIVDNGPLLGSPRVWVQIAAGVDLSGTVRPNFESGSYTFGSTLTDGTCTWLCAVAYSTALEFFVGPPTLLNSIVVNDGWQPAQTVPADQVIEAPVGYFQFCSSPGTTGSSHPAFSTTLGGSTTDNSVTWKCMGRSTHAINPSNSALCVNDYLQDTDVGLSVPASTINTASVVASANVCEEQELIIWNADGTVVYENLYSCNGMFDHSSQRGNVLTSLCGSMAGWVVPPGDAWYVFAGAYTSPTVSLTDSDLRGPIKGDFRLSRRDVANGVKGTYLPAYLPTNPGGALSLTQVPGTWQSQSFPAYQANGLAGKPDYMNTEDGGQIIWQDIQLDFTTSLWMAQRLAKIAMMRLRFQQTLTLPFKLTAFALSAGDTFAFYHPHWGIIYGAFEITQCSIACDSGGKDNAPTLGVDIVARQTDPSIYSFTGPSSSTNYGEYSPYGITGVMTGVE